jgi:K+-sensing histidine kinase KdpD
MRKGIKPEFQDEIFFMFERRHAKSECDGTGLGLAICTRLVTALNGRITVKIDLGQGSLFFVHLPNELISNTSSKPTPFKVFSFTMQTNFRKPLNL